LFCRQGPLTSFYSSFFLSIAGHSPPLFPTGFNAAARPFRFKRFFPLGPDYLEEERPFIRIGSSTPPCSVQRGRIVLFSFRPSVGPLEEFSPESLALSSRAPCSPHFSPPFDGILPVIVSLLRRRQSPSNGPEPLFPQSRHLFFPLLPCITLTIASGGQTFSSSSVASSKKSVVFFFEPLWAGPWK